MDVFELSFGLSGGWIPKTRVSERRKAICGFWVGCGICGFSWSMFDIQDISVHHGGISCIAMVMAITS